MEEAGAARARAQPLRPGHRSRRRPAATVEERALEMRARGAARDHASRWRVKLSPFYSSLPHFAQRARRGRRRRPGAVQPLLPARHRPRGRSTCVRTLHAVDSARAAAAAALAGDPLRPAAASPWRPAAACTPPLDAVKAVHGRRARRADGLGAAAARARAPGRARRRDARSWFEEHEYDSLASCRGQHEPRALPGPAPPTSGPTTSRSSRAGTRSSSGHKFGGGWALVRCAPSGRGARPSRRPCSGNPHRTCVR